ncbi:unnamed protein product [Mytilus coruscus]|nr:unnamed protein product [Mytilus coruscus]
MPIQGGKENRPFVMGPQHEGEELGTEAWQEDMVVRKEEEDIEVQGYKLEFNTRLPLQRQPPKYPMFNREQKDSLNHEIQKLLEKEAIQTVHQEHSISKLHVSGSKKGRRKPSSDNLKKLNNFITYIHFKMEVLYMVRDLLKRGEWMCKIDLKDAYLTTNIYEEDRKSLKFLWDNKIYQFTCLPFGLANAPRIYTKLMKPVVGLLRKIGIHLIIYLDHILLMADSKEKLIEARDCTLFLLINLGFVINWEKSKPNPSQQVGFLGFQIDSQEMLFTLSQEKVVKIKQECHQILNLQRVTVRQLAKITGKLVSTLCRL